MPKPSLALAPPALRALLQLLLLLPPWLRRPPAALCCNAAAGACALASSLRLLPGRWRRPRVPPPPCCRVGQALPAMLGQAPVQAPVPSAARALADARSQPQALGMRENGGNGSGGVRGQHDTRIPSFTERVPAWHVWCTVVCMPSGRAFMGVAMVPLCPHPWCRVLGGHMVMPPPLPHHPAQPSPALHAACCCWRGGPGGAPATAARTSGLRSRASWSTTLSCLRCGLGPAAALLLVAAACSVVAKSSKQQAGRQAGASPRTEQEAAMQCVVREVGGGGGGGSGAGDHGPMRLGCRTPPPSLG